ncbi:SPOC like C-terminal domain-containing protein [Dunaliella salina]|uniref:SPOC like C-terminal domain-containing protein n=1 Tax=Dunaliella salina TaxID=3046 RepID=A0ABQ7GWX4_DUNSA|nr:SPOC like C-terminal domain-containing protein [Dunaliella salina]|eukprot:KAF5839117.1 SPOC like C-terminal domain-containing protein [Dunaliella salina]
MSLMQLDKPKDFCCMLVDVGPHMHSILPQVKQFVTHFVEAKLINKPAHEVALILLGSTGTRNEVNQEYLEQGHPGQYENISVVENLSTPNLGTLKTASCLECGTGITDIYNGLLVVLDLFKKASKDRHIPEKHCVLVSNFACQSEPIDDVTLAHITENFQSIRLDMVCPDMELEQQDGQQAINKAIRAANEVPLTDMLTKLGLPGPQHAHSTAELLSLIRWKEVKPSATFDGLLTVGSKLAIPVKMFKKTGKESTPSLKSYTLDQGILTEVHYQRSHVSMKQMAAEDRLKPCSMLCYCDCRYAFNKESIVVIANKDDPPAGLAVSALVRSMASKDQVAVVRMVRTNNGKPELLAFSPRLASPQEGTPDCWIANGLPFEQEVQWSSFPDMVSKAEHEPSQEQRDAAHSLVKNMDLSDVPLRPDFGPQELLRPEHVVNPVLHRFYACVAKRAMDSQAQLPPKDSDPLRRVLQPNARLLTKCDPELQRLKVAAQFIPAIEQAHQDGVLAWRPSQEKA